MDYSVLDEKSAYELIKGKRVVVIGSQKSAMDFAVECADANRGMLHITNMIQHVFPFIQFNFYGATNGFSLILGRRRWSSLYSGLQKSTLGNYFLQDLGIALATFL